MKRVGGAFSGVTSSAECRAGCGACCVAPSIASPIPGMPGGKPAGVRCVQLTADNRCRLFGRPERPQFCVGLTPGEEMCGRDAREAYTRLTRLERATDPSRTRQTAPSRARQNIPPILTSISGSSRPARTRRR